MHGLPRRAPKPEEEEALAAKARDLRALQTQLLSNHHSKIYTKEALDVSAKLLEKNPECYTAWNYRKLAVQHNLLAATDSDPGAIKSILDAELQVVVDALKQNYKSYGAWHHRKWVLSKGHCSLDYELKLLKKFQMADSRNFHAWNYRRFVAALLNRMEKEELDYTTEMIENNFSNYSAWHNRSVLLSSLLKKEAEGFYPKEKVLNDEYGLVQQAIFTDPDDQSGWFHYRWLLDQTVKLDAPSLVSSWPANGSNVMLSRIRRSNDCSASPFEIFHSNSGTFPLVLYFNQPVKGVSSSTVIIESLFCKEDLDWKPLSQISSQFSQVWVTHIQFPEANSLSEDACSLEVSIRLSRGIISTSGFDYSHHTRLAFKVYRCPVDSEPSEKQVRDQISWRDESFSLYQTRSEEPHKSLSIDNLIYNVDEPTTSNWHAETIANEIATFRELLSETSCKIGKLTLARLLTAQDVIQSQCGNKMVNFEEVLELYADLLKLDPTHGQYYNDELSLLCLRQVTSSKESLLKYCFSHETLASSSIGNYLCLRLNKLSLTRMGSIEKLLWVQMLDLSHNELRSIEGLEAMQLLSCLNLSNNKLGSFTALAPLRMLKSLQVLDISCNEIGSHTIDKTRYLCTSPLSHTEETSWKNDKIMNECVNVASYWDAFLTFKSVSLTQLSIYGNTIADENFKLFLVKVLPILEWLDGNKVH
ncbi:geranylgeranyl transferase type-2 subunit alpha 1 [Argentina anserina]|uniref:geranylgeranyl transferase type-2 subunit alpha 1 n=1 Tax=Argentina anserina TaxID=57926 RepID=UPI0021768D4C|nr:geranylgeranyl transferase type-2 subunit alpha 1 [Potentilla anserina]